MKNGIFVSLAALALTLGAVGAAHAAVVIDSVPSIIGMRSPISGPRQRGIAFTTGANGPYTITDLKVDMDLAALTSFSLQVAIYETSAGLPTGSAVASTTMTVTPVSTGRGLYDATDLGTLGTFSLASSTEYALAFGGSTNLGNIMGGSTLAPTVTDGFSVNQGLFAYNGAWSSTTTTHPTFQLSAAVPEPTVLGGILAASTGLLLRKRKRKQITN